MYRSFLSGLNLEMCEHTLTRGIDTKHLTVSLLGGLVSINIPFSVILLQLYHAYIQWTIFQEEK